MRRCKCGSGADGARHEKPLRRIEMIRFSRLNQLRRANHQSSPLAENRMHETVPVKAVCGINP
jgi:hypothetical protein